MHAISRRHRFESLQPKAPAVPQAPAAAPTASAGAGSATSSISDQVSFSSPETGGDESTVSNQIDTLNGWLGSDPYASARSGSAGSAVNFGDAGNSKAGAIFDAFGGGLDGITVRGRKDESAPAPVPVSPVTPSTPTQPQTPTQPTGPVEGPPLYDPGYFDNSGGN